MAKYQKTVSIWDLSDYERDRLQPGQWIRAGGAGGALGRYAGKTAAGVDVAQWMGGDKSLKRFRQLRVYVKGNR